MNIEKRRRTYSLPPPHINNLNPKPKTQSSPKHPLLQKPQPSISDRAKRKRQRKAHVPPKRRQPDPLPDRADEPDLRHAHDGAEDAEAKGHNGRDAGREEGGGGVDGDVVGAAGEDEVFRQGDAFVDGEPVTLGIFFMS